MAEQTVGRELRCSGCGRLLGTTTRTQAVPARCTDPLCVTAPAISANEERDSFIEYLAIVEQRSPESIGNLFNLTRQGVARILTTREAI